MWGSFIFIFAFVFALPVWAAESRAVFAAGHFWHAQAAFDSVKGVTRTVVGYAGGRVAEGADPALSGGYQVVEVTYDADVISYDRLLYVFLRMIDPTDAGGQFCHRGAEYRPAVFVSDVTQHRRVTDVLGFLEAEALRFDGRDMKVAVLPLRKFYVADDSHQRYYRKNALRYGFIDQRCGRAQRLRAVWGR